MPPCRSRYGGFACLKPVVNIDIREDHRFSVAIMISFPGEPRQLSVSGSVFFIAYFPGEENSHSTLNPGVEMAVSHAGSKLPVF